MNKFYTTLFFISGSFFAINAGAQNVHAIQTSTNPQPHPVNNSQVIVIPKSEHSTTNKNTAHSGQKGNSNGSVHKVENKNQQGNNQKKQEAKPTAH